MLQIHIPKGEFWDERKEEFMYTKSYTLRLEHSLVSISKWEAKWHISFFETKLNTDQFLSYIKCMTLNTDVTDDVYNRLTDKDLNDILDYIKDPMTASKVEDTSKSSSPNKEYITSELVYYWMCKFNIPAEFEKWHIARLIMLIRICIAKETPGKKMTKAEVYAKQAEINARNKARRHTRG